MTGTNRPPPKIPQGWDALAEPALARFLRVIQSELGTSVAAELKSDRSRNIVDMVRRVLGHLIAREEQLELFLGPVLATQSEVLQCLSAQRDDRRGSDDADHSAAFSYLRNAELLEGLIPEAIKACSAGDSSDARATAGWRALKQLVCAEDQLHAALEQFENGLLAQQPSAAEAAVADLPRPALTRYLQARIPDGQDIAIDNVVTLLGGYSKDTFIVELSGSKRPADAVVIRRDLAHGPLEVSVTQEFAVIKAMHEAGVPVARPLWVEADPSVIGAPFLAVERMPGTQLVDVQLQVVGEGVTECVRELARVLARIHSVPPASAGIEASAVGRPTGEHILELLEQYEEQWRRRRMGPSCVITAGLEWMKHNVPANLPRACIVHGDATVRNMLFANGRATAMLDWETWHLGDPGEDLSYSRIDVERFLPWSEFIAEYRASGGAPFSAESERYWGMWVYLRGAITSVAMMDRLTIDPPADIRPAFAGPHFTRLCIRKVAEFMKSL
ncbi:MAG: phosphotransferase family protein [Steroidobacteraceae bacterium]